MGIVKANSTNTYDVIAGGVSDTIVTLYDDAAGIQGGNYILLTNLSQYKKLEITFTIYKSTSTNNGGTGNTIILDLTKPLSNWCRCGVVVPYTSNYLTSPIIGTDFRAWFEADLTNNKLYCAFAYGTTIKNADAQYTMNKVVGYK